MDLTVAGGSSDFLISVFAGVEGGRMAEITELNARSGIGCRKLEVQFIENGEKMRTAYSTTPFPHCPTN